MSVRELSSPPSLTSLYPKALAGAVALPVLRRVPLVGPDQPEGDLPDIQLELSDAELDRDHVAEYNRVCGFRLRDELPPTYPHILAFPISMEIMTDSSFPFGVLGLVHVRNRIEQRRRIRVDERLTVRVHTADLEEHPKGTQFDVVAEAEVDGEPVWSSRSTYLHKEGGGSGGGGKDKEEREEPPQPRAVWKVPGDIGRRYAAVSGDRNPIHLHPVTARLFGMPKPIAHGMWMKARCLAALEGKLPDAFAVDVRFKTPLFIPGRAGFAVWEEGEGRGFALHGARDGKPHLTGTVEPLGG